MRLSSPIGDFYFAFGTPLSLAKVVRDNVVGQVLNPKPGEMSLETTDDISAFVRGRCGNVVAEVEFTFIPKQKQ